MDNNPGKENWPLSVRDRTKRQRRMEEVENIRGALKVYSDGTIYREKDRRLFQTLFNSSLGEIAEIEVASKDRALNDKLGLWVRLYLPSPHLQQQPPRFRLPVIVYFHGGGFCVGSPAVPEYHNFCLTLAATVGAIVVSVAYRLAPEHRLPAAYNDCITALEWVSSHAGDGGEFEHDPWLKSYADLSAVYLMGDSAGANIAHQVVALRGGVEAWSPIKLRGSILVQPYFGSERRRRSENECPSDAVLNLEASDAFWRLSLPVGSDRDHLFSNPWSPGAPKLEEISMPPLLVAIGGRDILRDRGHEYSELLKQKGKSVEVVVVEEEEHGFYILRPKSQSLQRLCQQISRFISAVRTDNHTF